MFISQDAPEAVFCDRGGTEQFLYYRHITLPQVEGNFCPIELKSLDYRHVLYFRKALDARMSEMMFRPYIGNVSVKVMDISAIYWLEKTI